VNEDGRIHNATVNRIRSGGSPTDPSIHPFHRAAASAGGPSYIMDPRCVWSRVVLPK